VVAIPFAVGEATRIAAVLREIGCLGNEECVFNDFNETLDCHEQPKAFAQLMDCDVSGLLSRLYAICNIEMKFFVMLLLLKRMEMFFVEVLLVVN
jgi:hypothetical protein